jgi:hypothetical protein
MRSTGSGFAASSARLPGEREDIRAERGLSEVAPAFPRLEDFPEEDLDDSSEPLGMVRALGERRQGPLLDGAEHRSSPRA